VLLLLVAGYQWMHSGFEWLPMVILFVSGAIVSASIVILAQSFTKRLRKLTGLMPLIGEARFQEVHSSLENSANTKTPNELDQLEDSLRHLSAKMEDKDRNIDFHNKEIERMSLFDTLTGLANRHLFLYEVQNDLLEIREEKREDMIAVIMIDLDKFKRINDSLGHQLGDLLLEKLGKRLKKATSSLGLLGRPGGDEFAILLRNLKRAEQLDSLCNKLQALISRPINLGETSVVVNASIGVAASSAGDSASDLVRHAEIAMYKAKDSGGNNYSIFSPEMASEAHDNLLLESEIRHAFEEEEFTLYLQPKVDMNNKIRSFEALVRWEHPEKGLIPPGQFIPAMENMNFISQLDDWILETSCRQLKILMQHYPGLSIAVNISSTRFAEQSFLDFLRKCLKDYEIDPSHLELEITESMLMENMAGAMQILHEIKSMGISIAIDDFGTGYSSLSYLKDLPVNTVKIDRAFIMDIPDSEKDMQISSVIIYLAKKLNYKVVAEGVETKDQVEFLKDSQCDLMQGFYFSKPIPAHKVLLMLETERLIGLGLDDSEINIPELADDIKNL
jgi:diguanylate cyclase (GGDEF)-like protein